MDYENISQKDKCAVLQHAVFTKSPEELSALYRQLEPIRSSARALGLACRFRGLEHVKALVESGANFNYVRPKDAGGYDQLHYWLSPLEMNVVLQHAGAVDIRDTCFTNRHWLPSSEMDDMIQQAWFNNIRDACHADVAADGAKRFNVLPVEQRAEIVKYLYEHREKVCLDVEELLFYAIMSGSRQITKVLKEYGVGFSKQRITRLMEGGRSNEWWEFCHMSEHLGDEDYLDVVGSIVREMEGNRLYYTDAVYQANYNTYRKQYRLYKPEFFQFILEHFNQKKMNKTKLMRGAIDQNSVECLEICTQNGWLQLPQRREEMIRYASENDATECSAWLLEYKNRTADFAAERERAEKKMMRELNANPNSVTELKKIWGYEKREDDTLVITRYKGKQIEIEVPEKIGNRVVSAIGSWAFSFGALRLKKEQIELRKAITRITLPKTIRAIGECAFYGCRALVQINIPNGITAIGARAFWSCKCLSAIELPDSVTEIGDEAFAGCNRLKTVELPEGITEIGKDTFRNCQSLKSVTIPGTVEIIRRGTFYGCTALETAVISEGVAEIRQKAFADCTNLRSVVLPQSVRAIKNDTKRQTPVTVFNGDASLTVTAAPKSYAEKYCRRNNIPVTE